MRTDLRHGGVISDPLLLGGHLRLLEIATAIEKRMVSDHELHTPYPFEITWWKSQEEAGNEVGLGRQTVSKVFAELRDEGVIYGGEEGWRDVELIPGCKSKLEKLIARELKKPKKKG